MEKYFLMKEQIVATTASVAASFSWKTPLSILIGGMSFFFGIENYNALIALLSLMVIDFITGIASAYKTGQPVESKRAMKSAVKVVVYSLLVSAAYLTEKIIPGVTFIDESVISFLALTELISVIENVGKMGFAVPMKLLNRLQELREQK